MTESTLLNAVVDASDRAETQKTLFLSNVTTRLFAGDVVVIYQLSIGSCFGNMVRVVPFDSSNNAQVQQYGRDEWPQNPQHPHPKSLAPNRYWKRSWNADIAPNIASKSHTNHCTPNF